MIDNTATDRVPQDGPLLFGRVLDGKGGGRKIDWQQVQGWKPANPDEVLWLH